jgi:[acyl-carrier-protein] S-malonyltransferase
MFDLTGDAPEASALFAHATTLLGADPRDLVRSAGWDALHENRIAQVLCALQALSAAEALGSALPSRYSVAGYSIGEVAAWGVSVLIDASETLDLVAARASAMDAVSRGDEGMLFIRGLDHATVERLCANRDAAIAIVNPGDAWVLGGRQPALEAIAAEARGLGATRVVPVAVGVASHTWLLAEASTAFRHTLADARIARALRAGIRLFSGVDGAAVLDGTDSLDKLASQISHPVQWATCLEGCIEAGASAFLELGPGRALAEMAAAAYPGVSARSLDDFRSLQGVRAWLERVQSP